MIPNLKLGPLGRVLDVWRGSEGENGKFNMGEFRVLDQSANW